MFQIIHSDEEYDQTVKQDGLVVVYFFATWCGPCKMTTPLLERMSRDFPDAKFYKADVDQLTGVTDRKEISSMPTTYYFKNGVEVGKVVGTNPAALKQVIVSYI